MNSPTSPVREPRKWIITSCRGRLAHLRESLPSWLEHLSGWDPIVVCCDDPQVSEYARGELKLAGRGLALSIRQGRYFNKLEAERAGLVALGLGISQGDALDEEFLELSQEIPPDCNDMVALVDADITALEDTLGILNSIPPEEIGVCGWGTTPDDFGVLIIRAGLLWQAIKMLPIGWFEGYGPEDMALRICAWTLHRRSFVPLPALWAHRQHTDRERMQHHSHGMAESGRKNTKVMHELIERIVPLDERKQMTEDAMFWPKPLAEYYRAS